LVPAGNGRGHEPGIAPAGSGRFYTSFGLDPAVLTTVGYVRGFELGSRTALWELDLGLAVAAGDAEDLRLRVGFQTTLWQAGDWRLAGRGRHRGRRGRGGGPGGSAAAARR
jgi:hypothetical protein